MMSRQRLFSLDFLKFVAALMITNSHFQPLYEDVSPALATFGVHGNALFFFVSGFLLMMGFMRKGMDGFVDWYKKRMRRLWPAVFLWTILAAVFFGRFLTVGNLVLFDGYWFLQAIAVSYVLYYLVCRLDLNFGGGKHRVFVSAFCLSILVSIVYFFVMPVAEASPFHTNFHFVCHFSVMMLGGMCCLMREKVVCKRLWKDTLYMLVSFVLYFLILKVGKGQVGIRYYLQVLALAPLHTFVFYLFKVSSYSWCGRCFQTKYVGRMLSVVAALTLEIYIVQFDVISNRLNSFFPLSVVIVFGVICIAAYFLKVLTSLFLFFLSTDRMVWKEMLRI